MNIQSIEVSPCVNQRNMHDATTSHGSSIVLQCNCIENELYIGLVHIFCIKTIDMFTIDDKDFGYSLMERCNIILI